MKVFIMKVYIYREKSCHATSFSKIDTLVATAIDRSPTLNAPFLNIQNRPKLVDQPMLQLTYETQ